MEWGHSEEVALRARHAVSELCTTVRLRRYEVATHRRELKRLSDAMAVQNGMWDYASQPSEDMIQEQRDLAVDILDAEASTMAAEVRLSHVRGACDSVIADVRKLHALAHTRSDESFVDDDTLPAGEPEPVDTDTETESEDDDDDEVEPPAKRHSPAGAAVEAPFADDYICALGAAPPGTADVSELASTIAADTENLASKTQRFLRFVQLIAAKEITGEPTAKHHLSLVWRHLQVARHAMRKMYASGLATARALAACQSPPLVPEAASEATV